MQRMPAYSRNQEFSRKQEFSFIFTVYIHNVIFKVLGISLMLNLKCYLVVNNDRYQYNRKENIHNKII